MPWGVKLKLRKKIVDSDADYVLALKANQGQLYEDVQLLRLTGDIDSAQTRRSWTFYAYAISDPGVIS